LCGLGLVAGFILGAGFALAKEKLSGKIYSEREIKKLVPFDVIAEIPPIETAQEQVSSQRSTWMAGVAAVVIVGFILVGSAVTYLYG
jgi:hypothetical protein